MEASSSFELFAITIAVLGLALIAYREYKEEEEDEPCKQPPPQSPAVAVQQAPPHEESETTKTATYVSAGVPYHHMAVEDAVDIYKLDHDRRYDESGQNAAIERRRSVLREEAAAANKPDAYMLLD